VNDAPVARQSRDRARPQPGESTLLHQKIPNGFCRLGFFIAWWIRRGAGVNDTPVARQSRDRARPEPGESTLLHPIISVTFVMGIFYFLFILQQLT